MHEEFLRENEYVEDLQFNSLKIILSSEMPSFTTDAVLLSDFAKLKKVDKAADFGTGTGVIALLVYGRYGCSVTGFEIQSRLCDMANRSFSLNGLSQMLHAENISVCDAYKKYNGAFSAVVCNPPYFSLQNSLLAANESRAVSRTQQENGLYEFVRAASRVLKSGGSLYMCYPAAMLTDLLYTMRMCKMEPKKLRFVRSTPIKAPYLVLVEAKKDGGKSLSFMSDLIICNSDGTQTPEILSIYHRNLPQ